jgi:hypothetical protein
MPLLHMTILHPIRITPATLRDLSRGVKAPRTRCTIFRYYLYHISQEMKISFLTRLLLRIMCPIRNVSLDVQIFPNPSSGGYQQIEFQLNNGMPVHMEVRDIDGRLVRLLKDHEYFGPGKHLVQLNTTTLASGIYFIYTEAREHSTIKKIIIQK